MTVKKQNANNDVEHKRRNRNISPASDSKRFQPTTALRLAASSFLLLHTNINVWAKTTRTIESSNEWKMRERHDKKKLEMKRSSGRTKIGQKVKRRMGSVRTWRHRELNERNPKLQDSQVVKCEGEKKQKWKTQRKSNKTDIFIYFDDPTTGVTRSMYATCRRRGSEGGRRETSADRPTFQVWMGDVRECELVPSVRWNGCLGSPYMPSIVVSATFSFSHTTRRAHTAHTHTHECGALHLQCVYNLCV